MQLYDFELSGNCYKVRLLLSLLGLPYRHVRVDLAALEHKRPEFLRMNPRGQVPVLRDGPIVVWDSMAILAYLAQRYDGDWSPTDPVTHAQVMQWLAVSENEILYGLARARACYRFKRPYHLEECQKLGTAALDVLETRLTGHRWLAADRCTIADVACYPYVALAPEGGLSLHTFPGIQAWIARIQSLDGYVGMPGIDSAMPQPHGVRSS